MNKRKEYYDMISSKEEMKWFFDHCIFKPKLTEVYTLEFVCRHKKLGDEEKKELGLSRKEAEFLSTQTVRPNKFATGDDLDNLPWNFDKFYRHVSRFEVNTDGYTTATGDRLPQNTLVIYCYVNPGDYKKVVNEFIAKVDNIKENILAAFENGRPFESIADQYQGISNAESMIKHLQANCKGTVYWMDFDIDVPAWFKNKSFNMPVTVDLSFTKRDKKGKLISVDCVVTGNSYLELLKGIFIDKFGKGKFVIVDTGGGYHILVRTTAIKGDPHDICKFVDNLYKAGLSTGEAPYLDEKGNCKFECVINNSQIPGLPLPGTYQYGRPVTVLNKEDFE